MKLSEVEARCEKATKGPWSIENITKILMLGQDSYAHHEDDIHNAFFIAHSRTDLPEAIRLLREAREMFSQALEELSDPTENIQLIYKVKQWLSEVEE